MLGFLITRTEMRLSGEFASFSGIALALVVIAAFSVYRRHDWRLADSALIVAAATGGLMLCGLVSNIGLRLGLPLADLALARTDAYLKLDAPAAVRFTATHPLVAELLHQAYNSSGILCVAAIAWRLIQNNRAALWRTAVTAIVAMQATALISVLLPARGAILTFGLDTLQGRGLPFGAGNYSVGSFNHFYSGSDPLVTLSKLDGIVTFPSFHTVMALLILQGFHDTRLRMIALVWSALTIISTVPMGGHYVTDLAGGFVVWCAAYLLACWATPTPQRGG
jgi:membrane-associated phospholipid phosphatase